MEFGEKLQELRRKKGLTQEALADVLYVSRTAVSKWESGRGYPNIESLKAIACFFGVTVDALLSNSELLTIAEDDARQSRMCYRDLMFGCLDLSAISLLLLPLFGQKTGAGIQGVSLLLLTEIAPYLKVLYFLAVCATVGMGIAALALQACEHPLWMRMKHTLSPVVSAAGAILFVISLQPYAATFLLMISAIKVVMLLVRH